jgi:hypothetical protein
MKLGTPRRLGAAASLRCASLEVLSGANLWEEAAEETVGLPFRSRRKIRYANG